ncbi:MAG: protein TolR [Deltaproteobacteria bacterium]|nr:protein TolR [Deltaproteobacteria bacterium]MBW1960206.1 protein TolR [Deltaproteobacteria bacterium]MBW2150609.1 protein TolR [Deltaproteobacteria bacterium]
MILGNNNNGLLSDINVTPFVDVMLVLLIIFMVTAPMMVQGINVSLPEATSKPLVSEKEPLIITINKDNQIFINDYQVTLEFLQNKLAKVLEGRSDREVYFRADKEIAYGMVVRVMSEIRGAGVEKLGMVTIPLGSDSELKKLRAKR